MFISDYYEVIFKSVPDDFNDIRSVYHVREYNVNKLSQWHGEVEFFESQDWPQGIAKHVTKTRS